MHRIARLAASAFLLSGAVAFAQQPQASAPHGQAEAPTHHRHHHEHGPHRQAMMMSRRLNLSSDQTAKIEPILVAREQKVAALRSNASLTEQDRMQQFRAIHKEAYEQLAGVLTSEQREQMKAMRHHGIHGHGQPEGPAPSGL